MIIRRFSCGAAVVAFAVCFSLPTSAHAQFVYDGPERFVSGQQLLGEYISRIQQNAAHDAAGNYIVVWESSPSDAAEYEVFGRRFAHDGTALAPAFQVNQNSPRGQLSPRSAWPRTGASSSLGTIGKSITRWATVRRTSARGCSTRREIQ